MGVYIHSNGAKYEGDWKDDDQEGYGVETWTDGSIYEGYYKEGKKNGVGIYCWADGSMFIGQWVDSKIEGYGKYIWGDGRVSIYLQDLLRNLEQQPDTHQGTLRMAWWQAVLRRVWHGEKARVRNLRMGWRQEIRGVLEKRQATRQGRFHHCKSEESRRMGRGETTELDWAAIGFQALKLELIRVS